MNPPAQLTPPESRTWPLSGSRLEIVSRLDWLANPTIDRMPPAGQFFGQNLGPGELPPGTEHSCLVALGLLFTGETGDRMLFAADDTPLNLLVAHETSEIDEYLRPCFVQSIDEYARAFRS